MVFFVIGIAMGIGAMFGVLTSIQDGIWLMLVMGAIGAAFAGGIAGGLCAVVQTVTRKTPEGYPQDRFVSSALEDDFHIHSAQLMDMAKQWSDEKERFPIAGDPDPIAKSITGWRDAADMVRNRDIF